MGLAPLSAHGPTPQKADETIMISAPPEAVWKILADFGGIAGWHPLVKKATATGNEAGAERVLTLEKGEVKEGLDEADAGAMRLAYRLSQENIEALPVSFYTATIEVKPAAGGSEVAWSARFYRGDTSNFPPDELNDEAAVAAMTDFVKQGLEGLKAKAGGQ
ncbi:SRPBCC family protein [Ancylobacter radicis]|nr:SRPBCC family protein [Ancylobacter radicis]